MVTTNSLAKKATQELPKQLNSYQVLLVLSLQGKKNQSVLAADQEVSCYGAARDGDGTLGQRDLDDLRLNSAPNRRATQQVAQQPNPNTSLLLRLDRRNKQADDADFKTKISFFFFLFITKVISRCFMHLVAPVGVRSQVGGAVLFFNSYQVVSWRRDIYFYFKWDISVITWGRKKNFFLCFYYLSWRTGGGDCTYAAVLDTSHCTHGGKTTDKRADLLLQTVRLHL